MTNKVFELNVCGVIFEIDYEDKDKIFYNNKGKILRGWNLQKGYAVLNVHVENRVNIVYPLHKLLMGFGPLEDILIDHKDCNPKNCRKNNLRVCNISQNNFNRSVRTDKLYSKFKGVSFHRRRKKFTSQIKVKTETINLWSSDTQEECAYSYDIAAIIVAKEFANINNIELIDRNKAEEVRLYTIKKLNCFNIYEPTITNKTNNPTKEKDSDNGNRTE